MPTLTKKQRTKVEKKALQESRAREKAVTAEEKALKRQGLGAFIDSDAPCLTSTSTSTAQEKGDKGKGKAVAKTVKDKEARPLTQSDKDRLDAAFEASQHQRRGSLDFAKPDVDAKSQNWRKEAFVCVCVWGEG